MSSYKWYTGSKHPMHELVFISHIENTIIFNDPLRCEIIRALPYYSIRVEHGELYIPTAPGVYHSLYNELENENKLYRDRAIGYIIKCPPPIVQYIF